MKYGHISMKSEEIGKKGEDVACQYLVGKGHTIADRNFKVKSGEIDVVSEKNGTLFFIEVKPTVQNVARPDEFRQRPEENVTSSKMSKLSRAIRIYLEKKYKNRDVSWEFWVVAITLDLDTRKAFVNVIPEVLVG